MCRVLVRMLVTACAAAAVAGCGGGSEQGGSSDGAGRNEGTSTSATTPGGDPTTGADTGEPTNPDAPPADGDAPPADPDAPPADGDADAAEADLRFEVRAAPGEPAAVYRLRCPGRDAEEERRCEYLRDHPALFEKPRGGMACTQQFGGTETVRVTGQLNGVAVREAFSRTNGCEISRSNAIEPLWRPEEDAATR